MVALLEYKNAVASGSDIVGANTSTAAGTDNDDVSFERRDVTASSQGQLDEVELKASAASSMGWDSREANDLGKGRGEAEPGFFGQAIERSIELANWREVGL